MWNTGRLVGSLSFLASRSVPGGREECQGHQDEQWPRKTMVSNVESVLEEQVGKNWKHRGHCKRGPTSPSWPASLPPLPLSLFPASISPFPTSIPLLNRKYLSTEFPTIRCLGSCWRWFHSEMGFGNSSSYCLPHSRNSHAHCTLKTLSNLAAKSLVQLCYMQPLLELHASRKYLLSADCVPGNVMGPGVGVRAAMNPCPPPPGLFSRKETHSQPWCSL